MANYNGARFLPAAIQSLMAQTLRSWELILVDDASTDESVAVAEQAANGDSRVRIVRRTVNGGSGAARNRGLELARAEWIAVLDSDDLILPQRLQVLRDSAEQDHAVVVADNLMVFSDTDAKRRRFLRNHLGRSPSWIDLARFIESTKLYSSTPDLGYLKPMIRTEIVRRLNLRYDERLRIGEDYHFLAQILAAGHRLRLYPSAMYLYRKHGMSVSHRMTASDVRALIHADDMYFGQASLGDRERRAIRRRRHMLDSLLVFDDVINALKAGDLLRAAVIGLPHPNVWRLMTRPISARLKRFSAAIMRRGGRSTRASVPAALTPEFGTEHGHVGTP